MEADSQNLQEQFWFQLFDFILRS